MTTENDVLAPRIAPTTPDALHRWIDEFTGVEVARSALVPGNSAPFEYLLHTYFEGAPAGNGESAPVGGAERPPPDCAVWANRGGGKTFLGALATLLDLVFKDGIEVRVLGGSLEQSQRMHEYLRRFFEHQDLAPMLVSMTDRRIVLTNGSRAQVLSQSQASVRGTRVQKIRCDEVELFDREIWEAAQLTTRSLPVPGPWGALVRGSVEALSTMHRPYGLMWDIVGETRAGEGQSDGAMRGGGSNASPTVPAGPLGEQDENEQNIGSAHAQPRTRRLFRWGIVDTLGECGPERACDSCDLFPECAGRAKQRPPGVVVGHVSIDDALKMKSRVGAAVWEAEMVCLRPRRDECVLSDFDPNIHIGDWPMPEPAIGAAADPLRTERVGRNRGSWDRAPVVPAGQVLWIAGMDFGFRAPTVVLVGWLDCQNVLRIEAEHVVREKALGHHISAIARGLPAGTGRCPRPWWIGIDPSGNAVEGISAKSPAEALAQAGLTVRSRGSEVQAGLRLIRDRLRPAMGGPRLFVHRRCTTLIECVQRYHYDPNKPESMEPVKDGFDHAIDALRYLILNLDNPSKAEVGRYC